MLLSVLSWTSPSSPPRSFRVDVFHFRHIAAVHSQIMPLLHLCQSWRYPRRDDKIGGKEGFDVRDARVRSLLVLLVLVVVMVTTRRA